jgi:hypothetical protein
MLATGNFARPYGRDPEDTMAPAPQSMKKARRKPAVMSAIGPQRSNHREIDSAPAVKQCFGDLLAPEIQPEPT